MADIKLDWQLPASTVDMTNIDTFVIYKKAGASCADLQTLASDNDATYKLAVSGSGTSGNEINDLTIDTYTDTGVTQGTYTYGIYAKNSVGVSPCKGPNSGDDSIAIVTVA